MPHNKISGFAAPVRCVSTITIGTHTSQANMPSCGLLARHVFPGPPIFRKMILSHLPWIGIRNRCAPPGRVELEGVLQRPRYSYCSLACQAAAAHCRPSVGPGSDTGKSAVLLRGTVYIWGPPGAIAAGPLGKARVPVSRRNFRSVSPQKTSCPYVSKSFRRENIENDCHFFWDNEEKSL